MTAVTIAAGLAIGFGAGFYAGHDLGHSSAGLGKGRLVVNVLFGLLRRMVVIAAGFFAALALGRPAFAAAAVGTVGGFALAVALKVRG